MAATSAGRRTWLEREVRVAGERHGFRVWRPGPDPLPPAILFLHGKGESGTDNGSQLTVGLPRFVSQDPDAWPFLVIAPQKPDADRLWPDDRDMLEAILHAVEAEFPSDPLRRYLTGLSQGGNGTLALAARLSWRFAAVAPVCGWADPMRAARDLGATPVWAFHGLADAVVPASCTRAVADCMGRFGPRPRLSLYPGVEHNAWDRAYGEDGPGPGGLAAWFLGHRLDTAAA
jgi:predicted peptidase